MKRLSLAFLPLLLLAGSALAGTFQITNVSIQPEFICPGQEYTVTFQSIKSASNQIGQFAGALSYDGTWQDANDWLILANGAQPYPGTNPVPFVTTWADPAYAADFVNWETHSYRFTAPAGLVSGSVINVIIKGLEGGANWIPGMVATASSMVSTVVDCNRKAVYNTAMMGSQEATGRLVIRNSCGTPSFTPTRTRTPTPTATRSSTVTFTTSRTATPTSTPSITVMNSPTYTATLTRTPTSTPSRTPSATPTVTVSITATATPTLTPTRSATVSSTRSFTPSSSPTISFSSTQTVTSSSTPTRTPTRTASPTATISNTITPGPSPTFSSTQTATASVTMSRTPTATPSASATRTATSSVTVTRSPTVSPSPTGSGTATPSASLTPSATPSVTPTFSNSSTITPGPSPTFSSTRTPTFSVTHTRTPTATPSATPSVTPTFTDSSTITPGPSPTFSSTRTPTPSETLTRTPTATPSATRTETPSSTVTPTATETSPNTPSFTPTASPSSTATLSRTVTLTATPSSTASVTFTSSATRTPTPSATPSFSFTPTRSATATATISFTFSPTPVPMPFNVKIGAYNAAGELVRSIYSGPASVLPGNLILGGPSLALGGEALRMDFPGTLEGGGSILRWNGGNDAGQAVSTGTYYIKMETSDPFGKVTSTIYAVQVMDARPVQMLAIFSASGELVREIPLPAGLALNGFSLGSQTLAVGSEPGLQDLKVMLRSGPNQAYVSSWDGKNDSENYVSGGVYNIVLISRQGGNETRVESKGVQVLRAPSGNAAADAHALLNPLPASENALRIVYRPFAGCSASAELFNLAGERLGSGSDSMQSGLLSLPWGNKSGGVYFVRLEIRDGARLAGSKIIKVAVLR